MTWAFRALFSLLRRSLSYSFLNRQFPYMIFIYLQLLIFISVLHTRTSAAKFEINFFAFINRTQKAIIHSTQVRAVKFGTHPKICVATFYTGFRVDANSYITSYVTRKWSIESCSLQEPDMILGKNIHFDYLQLTAELIRRYPFRLFIIDSRIDTALLFATLKITYTKIFAEKEKGALNGAFWWSKK